MTPHHWTDEQLKIFHEFAGKISDPELAKLIGVDKQIIWRRRNKLGIKSIEYEYTNAQLAYLKANFRTVGNRALALYINTHMANDRPGQSVTEHMVRDKLMKMGCVRTAEELANLTRKMDFADIRKKAWDTIGRKQIGDIFHAGNRMYIKVSETKKQLYHRWLWEQEREIPAHHYVAIIDRSKPITIENLQLRRFGDCLREEAQEMPDKWIVRMVARNQSKDLKNDLLRKPFLIETYRQLFILKRLVNGKNNQLAQPPSPDGE